MSWCLTDARATEERFGSAAASCRMKWGWEGGKGKMQKETTKTVQLVLLSLLGQVEVWESRPLWAMKWESLLSPAALQLQGKTSLPCKVTLCARALQLSMRLELLVQPELDDKDWRFESKRETPFVDVVSELQHHSQQRWCSDWNGQAQVPQQRRLRNSKTLQ